MDQVRWLLRPVRLPIPPRPQVGPGERSVRRWTEPSPGPVDPDGLEPSSSSLQGRCTATCALGPESAGQESNLPCRSAWVMARCRPTTATRGNGSTKRRAVACVATIDPVAGDLFNCQGASVGATRKASGTSLVALAGAQGIEPRHQRVWRPPGYRRLAPRLCCWLSWTPETKRAASIGRRLSTVSDL
jgi:hypothetical protein